ncbi:glycosyltransferase family 4 protein [Neobacillus drentensis]|uniref:glycosyltransferase family 4 protein n=1 Tax=Neobacillus drentensis TaxID=220684 RepID=UPI0030001557
MKVLWLTNIPSPYRVDFFTELGNYCDVTVLFERRNALDRENKWLADKFSNFKAIFLKSTVIGNEVGLSFEVLKFVKKNQYDIIIVSNYYSPTGMLMIKALKARKLPFGLVADGGIPKKDKGIMRWIKTHFIKSASFWLSSGILTDQYLISYGAKEEKIFHFPFTSLRKQEVDEAFLSCKGDKQFYKGQLGIKEPKAVLSIGQFIHRKGFDVLLKSAASLPDNFGVYIIGGEPTQEYINLINKFNIKNVHFVGFQTKIQLKEYYKACDLFVLPTREDIWGLVINEAMAFGLPVITTNRCVAGLELIKDYENGFIVPIEDIETLMLNIQDILDNDDIRQIMSNNNLSTIKTYTIENMAKIHFEIFKEILVKGEC